MKQWQDSRKILWLRKNFSDSFEWCSRLHARAGIRRHTPILLQLKKRFFKVINVSVFSSSNKNCHCQSSVCFSFRTHCEACKCRVHAKISAHQRQQRHARQIKLDPRQSHIEQHSETDWIAILQCMRCSGARMGPWKQELTCWKNHSRSFLGRYSSWQKTPFHFTAMYHGKRWLEGDRLVTSHTNRYPNSASPPPGVKWRISDRIKGAYQCHDHATSRDQCGNIMWLEHVQHLVLLGMGWGRSLVLSSWQWKQWHDNNDNDREWQAS